VLIGRPLWHQHQTTSQRRCRGYSPGAGWVDGSIQLVRRDHSVPLHPYLWRDIYSKMVEMDGKGEDGQEARGQLAECLGRVLGIQVRRHGMDWRRDTAGSCSGDLCLTNDMLYTIFVTTRMKNLLRQCVSWSPKDSADGIALGRTRLQRRKSRDVTGWISRVSARPHK
jgi:hypothetical protein